MTPKGVKAVMARPVVEVLLFAMALTATAPAVAGDSAMVDFIGFSEDRRYFAFEEFGIHDGSGGPYSSVYVIDLKTDSWAGGSPFRVSVQDEEAGLGDIRNEAIAKAGPAFDELDLAVPAEILALHADAEPDTDSTTISFGTYGPDLDPPVEAEKLDISTFVAKAAEDCEPYGVTPMGFALTLTTVNGETHEIHRDESVPASRGCALGYRLYAVVAPFYWQWNAEQAVAIVSVLRHGFEGPDRRFLAIPIPILP
jgi:predicted secreted protein